MVRKIFSNQNTMILTSITRNCTVFLLCRQLTRSATKIIYLTICIFHNKRFQMLFKDQIDRSKATCSFNPQVVASNPNLVNSSLFNPKLISQVSFRCDLLIHNALTFFSVGDHCKSSTESVCAEQALWSTCHSPPSCNFHRWIFFRQSPVIRFPIGEK